MPGSPARPRHQTNTRQRRHLKQELCKPRDQHTEGQRHHRLIKTGGEPKGGRNQAQVKQYGGQCGYGKTLISVENGTGESRQGNQ